MTWALAIQITAYLAPLLLVLLPLLAGRYPGADVLARPRRRRSAPARVPERVGRALLAEWDMPRGGRLVAASLAGRGPPARA